MTVVLNGVLIIDQARLPGVPPPGSIALEQHGDRKDGMWGVSLVQFRNISIRELK
jgi:hypothetical protein